MNNQKAIADISKWNSVNSRWPWTRVISSVPCLRFNSTSRNSIDATKPTVAGIRESNQLINPRDAGLFSGYGFPYTCWTYEKYVEKVDQKFNPTHRMNYFWRLSIVDKKLFRFDRILDLHGWKILKCSFLRFSENELYFYDQLQNVS